MKAYFDNAATTKMRKEVLDFLINSYENTYANPSSVHTFGRESRSLLEKSRNKIANLLKVKSQDIIFTSNATESNNLAIKGILAKSNKKEIITSKIEHSSILNIMYELEKKGYIVHYVKVNKTGEINLEDFESKINSNTALVCIMAVNSETGVKQPIKGISQILKKSNEKIYFHVDAVQMVGKSHIDIYDLGIDSLSASAHKFYGPKGVGILYIRDEIEIEKLFQGGSQERNKRSGTENINGILATELALSIAYDNMNKESKYIEELNNYLVSKIKGKFVINGENRVNNIINIQIKNKNIQFILPMLDMRGIMVSGGTACMSGSLKPSIVLSEMGLSEEESNSSIRISLSIYNTKEEIDYLVDCLEKI